MSVVATPAPEEVHLATPSRHDPLLDLFHNTRHASPRHAALRRMRGWQVRSPWLSRFDWVLDAHLEAEPGERGRPVLTKQRATPRSVFVKAGFLTPFLDHVEPTLERPVVVYVGNSNLPLSWYLGDVHRLARRPTIQAIFCENKDVDLPLPPVTAMPVGLHPADMLAGGAVRRLRRLASEVDPAAKRRRVLVPRGRAARRFGTAAQPPPLATSVASASVPADTLDVYWRGVAGHRFMLCPWGLPHDSPAPFEALILGTIPILPAGPLADAYDGLPVVTVGDPAEITSTRLDEWWETHAGALADAAFTSAAYWWARVATRLPDRTAPGVPATEAAEFPEWWFACSSAARPAYEQRVAAGRERMRASTVVFCGLARDVADALPSVSARIERAGAMFRDYRVVVYESDSRDDTAEQLRAWEQRNPRVAVLTETLGAPRWEQDQSPERLRHLAACRNRYLEYVTARHGTFDHVIVLDTDLPRGFSYEGLAHTFGGDGWHVVGSNSVAVFPEGLPPPSPMYFDAWAFRREGETTPRPAEETNRLFFRRGEPLVPVWSVFGGLAVYAMAALQSGARYGGDDCEHVVLHRELRARGFDRQYLNPSQIVLYAEAS